MYAKNCGYSSNNRKSLPLQLSDEADCGAVCSVTSTCAYFAFASGSCYLYSLANPSSKVVPLPSVSTSFSSCGYITRKKTPAPIWKEIKNNGSLILTITTASNCGYIGADPNDIGAQSSLKISLGESNCRITCAVASTCTQFRWVNGSCLLMQLIKPFTYYSVSGSCGYVNTRQTVSFTISGSKGLVKYSTNCDYTSDNRKTLTSFSAGAYSTRVYEEDCGMACAYTPTCSSFAFMYGYCNLYAIANTSSAVKPTPYTTTYYSSCGYVVSRKVSAIKWQTASNGQVMSAPNCSYIGLDPADAQIQSQNVKWLSELDCGSLCAATSTCSYYRWDSSSQNCHLMSIIKPVAFASTSGSCGHVVTRKPITWTTNGKFQFNSNCTFTYDPYIGYCCFDINSCVNLCNGDPKCNLFLLDGGWCNLITFTGQPIAYFSNKFACGKRTSTG